MGTTSRESAPPPSSLRGYVGWWRLAEPRLPAELFADEAREVLRRVRELQEEATEEDEE